MEMAAFPAHNILDRDMQVMKRVCFRDLYPPPDRRSDAFKRYLKLVNRIEFSFGYIHLGISRIICPIVVIRVFAPALQATNLLEILPIFFLKCVFPSEFPSRERVHDGSGRKHDIQCFQRQIALVRSFLLYPADRNLADLVIDVITREDVSCLLDVRDRSFILLSYHTVKQVEKIQIYVFPVIFCRIKWSIRQF